MTSDINSQLALAWKNKGYALKTFGQTAEASAANARASKLGYMG
jgi:hypothetical protein